MHSHCREVNTSNVLQPVAFARHACPFYFTLKHSCADLYIYSLQCALPQTLRVVRGNAAVMMQNI